METEIAISAQGLVKQFRTRHGQVPAVRGIDLQVGRGETFGLIGPDGAGKTTTIRLILGLLTRTAGESSILGYDSMRNPYEIRGRVGYIAQQFTLPPDMTRENMAAIAEELRKPENADLLRAQIFDQVPPLSQHILGTTRSPFLGHDALRAEGTAIRTSA